MDDLDYLCFSDYLDDQKQQHEWTLISHRISFPETNEHRYQSKISTWSVLMANKQEYIEKILKKYDWDVTRTFIKEYHNTEKDEIEFDNYVLETEQIEIAPFLFENDNHDYHWFGIHPDFINFYNLSFQKGTNSYADKNNNQIVRSEANEKIEIKTNYLRNYLQSKNLIMIRYHEHSRIVNRPKNEIIDKEEEQKIIPNDVSIFWILIHNPFPEREITVGAIRGKDIIYPQLMLTS